MRVNIYETVEVSDEQRVQIANLLDDKVTKRQATRDEMKRVIWAYGLNWEGAIRDNWMEEFGIPQDQPSVDDSPSEPPAELDDLL